MKGYDNLGNEVEFSSSRSSNEDFVLKYSNIERELSDDISSVTLKPYAAKYPEESGRMNLDFKQVGEEFTIILENEK